MSCGCKPRSASGPARSARKSFNAPSAERVVAAVERLRERSPDLDPKHEQVGPGQALELGQHVVEVGHGQGREIGHRCLRRERTASLTAPGPGRNFRSPFRSLNEPKCSIRSHQPMIIAKLSKKLSAFHRRGLR